MSALFCVRLSLNSLVGIGEAVFGDLTWLVVDTLF